MRSLVHSKDVLRGSVLGADHAVDLSCRLALVATSSDLLVLMDFSGIEAATASYLKEFLSPILGVEAATERCVFPLVTALSSDLRDDLHSFLSDKGWLLAEVKVVAGCHSFVGLIGTPEPTTERTYRLLRDMDSGSANQLFELCGEKNINPTAWNNRLMTLLRLRLARRSKQGRIWVYQTTTN